MLFSYLRGAAGALVVAACAGGVEAGTGSDEPRGSSGGQVSAVGIVRVTVDSSGLSAPPRFVRAPATDGRRIPRESTQDLILVPLPAPLWAAASGLTALAMVGLWRRHRLRAEH